VDEQAMAELVRRYWDELWGEGDLSVVDELFAESYVRHNRGGNTRIDRQQLKADMVQYWKALQNPRPTVHDLAVSGDRVWTRVTVRGTGPEETDVAVSFLQQFRIADGRLAEAWTLTAPEVDWGEAEGR
jgi:hypothetical protein